MNLTKLDRGLSRTITAAVCALAIAATAAPAYAEMPGDGITVQPMSTGRADHYFQHFVVQIGLENLGYTVSEHLEGQFPAIHLSIGQGDADYTAVHWNPLHSPFYDKAGGDAVMTRVGTMIDDAAQGYLVDMATAEAHNITNLSQLADPEIAKLFDSDGDGKANLTGCNPGWGCERVIEHQLEAFELRDTVSHDQGSYFALMADTMTRYKAGTPILYYTWLPLWVSSNLQPGKDVVWLDVPFSSLPDAPADVDTSTPDGRNPGFQVNTIGILANNEFLKANPAANRFFELVEIPIDDVNAAILRQHGGEDSLAQIRAHAEEWVAANQVVFDGWINDAKSAGN
jgi:glycine betaine/proline transport system substrate-binding protein